MAGNYHFEDTRVEDMINNFEGLYMLDNTMGMEYKIHFHFHLADNILIGSLDN
jgi:hypothetical protein